MNEITNVIRKKGIIVPNILIKYYKDLGISLSEVIFLSYLSFDDDLIAFNCVKFANDLNMTNDEVMQLMSNLCEKKLINMIVKKDNNVMKEYLDISVVLDKLINLLIKEENEDSDSSESYIYGIIESEFGRTLSSIEYETIKHWLDAKIDEELIKEALKEAVLNGVNNLKYIDKILFEWNKKGYKKPKDVKLKNNDDTKLEVFSCNWLEENE